MNTMATTSMAGVLVAAAKAGCALKTPLRGNCSHGVGGGIEKTCGQPQANRHEPVMKNTAA